MIDADGILSWLGSISDASAPPPSRKRQRRDSASQSSSTWSPKTTKTTKATSATKHLISPPVSFSAAKMSSSGPGTPQSRRKKARTSSALLGDIHRTPRQADFASLLRRPPPPAPGSRSHSSSYTTSSPIEDETNNSRDDISEAPSKASRASSPRKRKRDLTLSENIGWKDLNYWAAPASVQELLDSLADILDGYAFIPASLQPAIMSYSDKRFQPLDQFRRAFAVDAGDPGKGPAGDAGSDFQQRQLPGRCPSPDEIKVILYAAEQCANEELAENSWNFKVHLALLQSIFREPFQTDEVALPFDAIECTAAYPDRYFITGASRAHRVDLCVYMDPVQLAISASPTHTGSYPAATAITSDPGVASTGEPCLNIPSVFPPENNNPSEASLVADRIRNLRLLNTHTRAVNHTNYQALQNKPICLSIETKKLGEDVVKAELQLGVWMAAHWGFLSFVTNGDPAALSALPFLPALIIQGHEWRLVVSTRDEGGAGGNKITLWSSRLIGTTQHAKGVYQIIFVLRYLLNWMRNVYWPWFRTFVLQIKEVG
ncbi:hypothetical protein MKZ38_008924 [Zalerion maritima]|uniref:PD-(D/E)XK nuclease-like domain-containing protein n=1 Tax=Zalerion maritima TaxID=339359 RepID=A0AAD5RGR8_9PEZI|nr:hypothetical protein MKZ38_008924 [Zalerion maritima]